jgi:hypothetical protein
MIKLSDIILEQSGKPKAIVMAGGAGAGKSYLLNQLGLEGLKNYNPDTYVEDENHPFFNNLSAASGQVDKDVEAASEKGESFIWDTTASNPSKVRDLLAKGYDVFMVMIYTHPMISFIGNFSRDRRIPKAGVFLTWKNVYKLIDDYQNLLGDNFALFVNLREGKYDKEVADFNKAAEKGAEGIEDYLQSYMEAHGGREAFKSTFSKPFKLPDDLEKEFRALAANTTVDLEDESAYKQLAKDFQKYHHHFQSGKYGADRIQDKYDKLLVTREKLAQNALGDLESIADMLFDSTFQELLKSSSVKEIDSRIQRFLA